MRVTLDTNTIKSIDLFQKLTGTSVIDCCIYDDIYFVVAKGQYGLAVGKDGNKIKNAERVFKKRVRVFEYSPDLEGFIRNIIPDVQEIKIEDKIINVKVKQSSRARIIGKAGKNIKIISKFLERLFDMDELKVR